MNTADWIRTNLLQFNLADLMIDAWTMSRHGSLTKAKERVFTGLLSELCGTSRSFWCEGLEFRLKICLAETQTEIGYVDSDHRFNYTQARNLRTALAWALATDGGRVRKVELSRPLDELCESLKLIMRHTSKRDYFDLYHPYLKSIFDYENGSRFGDGYCGVSSMLWKLGTRENGLEHQGYSFMY